MWGGKHHRYKSAIAAGAQCIGGQPAEIVVGHEDDLLRTGLKEEPLQNLLNAWLGIVALGKTVRRAGGGAIAGTRGGGGARAATRGGLVEYASALASPQLLEFTDRFENKSKPIVERFRWCAARDGSAWREGTGAGARRVDTREDFRQWLLSARRCPWAGTAAHPPGSITRYGRAA